MSKKGAIAMLTLNRRNALTLPVVAAVGLVAGGAGAADPEQLLERWRQHNKRRSVQYQTAKRWLSRNTFEPIGIEVLMIGPFLRAGNLKYLGHPDQEWGACDAMWRAVGETRELAAKQLVDALAPFGELTWQPETAQEYVDRVTGHTSIHGHVSADDVDFAELDKIADLLGIGRRCA